MNRLVNLIFGRSHHVPRKRVREVCVTVLGGLVICVLVAVLLYYLNAEPRFKPSTPDTKPDPWTKDLPADNTQK